MMISVIEEKGVIREDRFHLSLEAWFHRCRRFSPEPCNVQMFNPAGCFIALKRFEVFE